MTSPDNKDNQHKNADAPDGDIGSRKTIRLLGVDIEAAQFWIMFAFLAPLALARHYGLFDYLNLSSLQVVAIVVPFIAAAVALAFVRIQGRYLYMVLAARLRGRLQPRTTPNEEDERA